MQVSEATKKAYKDKNTHKSVVISIPNLGIVINNDRILQESMGLSESIISGDNIEFVGCISSRFTVTVYDFNTDINGEYITVTIEMEGFDSVDIFHGVVDTVERQADKRFKKITAYDELYTKGAVNIAPWYNALQYPISLKNFRDELFEQIGIDQKTGSLPNDDINIRKEFTPVTLKAIDVIKSICQINGVCGIINRDGEFEYRTLHPLYTESGAYPGATLFLPFYPGEGYGKSTDDAEYIAFYKSVDYEEFIVSPVDKLIIRQNSDDEGVSFGEGENTYIIQGNMFTANKTNEELLQIAENIYTNVEGISFTPFNSDNNGLPYLEVGKDVVGYQVMNTQGVFETKYFQVLERELRGIQALRDSYSAEGDEYQTEFTSDLQNEINALKTYVSAEVQTQKLILKTWTNPSDVTITSQREQDIVKFNVATVTDCVPVLMASIPVEMAKDGNVILRYYNDGILLQSETITTYLPKGKGLITLVNSFDAPKDSRQNLVIKAQTEYFESDDRKNSAEIVALKRFAQSGTYTPESVDTTPPTGTIKALAIRALLWAQGLVQTSVWDGTLTVLEAFSPITLNRDSREITVNRISESIATGFYTPIGGEITEVFDAIHLDRDTRQITIGAVNETVSVDTE